MTHPLFSVQCYVRNRKQTIRRCLESVLSQDYPNIEFVIQDGASTDGTLEILRQYQDDRIKLISEPDAGPEEAFFKALKRCRGTFWCACLSDEALLPGALKRSADELQAHPEVGAIYGDAQVIDFEGNPLRTYRPAPDFSFEKFLIGQVMPLFSSAFFRLQAVRASPLTEGQNAADSELWLKMSAQYPIRYVPETFSRYGVGETTFSSNASLILRQLKPRLDAIDEVLRNTEAGRALTHLRKRAHAGIQLWYSQCLLNLGACQDGLQLAREALLSDARPDTLYDLWDKAAGFQRIIHAFSGDGCASSTSPMEFLYHYIQTAVERNEVPRAASIMSFVSLANDQDAFPRGMSRLLQIMMRKRPEPYAPQEQSAWIPTNLMSQYIRHFLQQEAPITLPLKKAGVERVFLYGGGDLGRVLYADCRSSGLTVATVIDQRGEGIQNQWPECPVLSPPQWRTAYQRDKEKQRNGSSAEEETIRRKNCLVLALYEENQETSALEMLQQESPTPPSSFPVTVSWRELVLFTHLYPSYRDCFLASSPQP